MASLMLGDQVIVTEQVSNNLYGDFRFIGHFNYPEIYQRSMPGASGILEVLSGDRYRRIQVQCRWTTKNAQAVNLFLDGLERSYLYDTLTIPAVTGGVHLYHFCRLESVVSLDVRETGMIGNDTVEYCAKMLTFLQVRM